VTHYLLSNDFNQDAPKVMHVDINSCFATIEQQANPLIRHKPVVVAASVEGYGCILASSIEAKTKGIKTGMRVKEAKQKFPQLIVLPTDPNKYRHIHHALKKVLSDYTPNITPKSVDEFSLDFKDSSNMTEQHMIHHAKDMKVRIKHEVGEHVSVSIGIGTNRFLAKTAAGLHKPNGLDSITPQNIDQIFAKLQLTDIHGISSRNQIRLNQVGITSSQQFLHAPLPLLQSAFRSINALYWYQRLRGWEIDDQKGARKIFSHSYVLPKPTNIPNETTPILIKLIHQLSQRIRRENYQAGSLFLSIVNQNHQHWHQHKKLIKPINNNNDYIHHFIKLASNIPFKQAKKITISCGDLSQKDCTQLTLFDPMLENEKLTAAIDQLNQQFGQNTLFPAKMLGTELAAPDAIGFGRI